MMLPVRFSCRPNGGFLGLDLRTPGRLFDLLNESDCHGFDVDLREDAQRYLIEANLPGVRREDVEITFQDGRLTITAEYNRGEETEGVDFHIRERVSGKMSRSFDFPNDVDSEKIGASMANGILTVTVEKRPEVQPRKITVQND